MAAISEEELEQLRVHNEKLREKIEDTQAKASEAIAEQSREIEAARLKAEGARLEAVLEQARQTATKTAAKEGAALPLEAAKEQLRAAQAGVTPPGVTVDTNTDSRGNSSESEQKG